MVRNITAKLYILLPSDDLTGKYYDKHIKQSNMSINTIIMY